MALPDTLVQVRDQAQQVRDTSYQTLLDARGIVGEQFSRWATKEVAFLQAQLDSGKARIDALRQASSLKAAIDAQLEILNADRDRLGNTLGQTGQILRDTRDSLVELITTRLSHGQPANEPQVVAKAPAIPAAPKAVEPTPAAEAKPAATKPAAVKKPAAKKPAAPKAPATKTAAKKPAAKTTTAKPAAAKTATKTAAKPAAKKPAAKTATAKPAAKKPAAKKPAAAKASTAKKAAPKTGAAKTAAKPAAKRTTTRKPAANKTVASKAE